MYYFLKWQKEDVIDYKQTIETIHKETLSQDEIKQLIEFFPLEWNNFLIKEFQIESKMLNEAKNCVKEIVLKDLPQEQEQHEQKRNSNKFKQEDDMLLLLDDLENISKIGSNIPKKEEQTSSNLKNNNNQGKSFDEKVIEVLIFLFSQSLNQRSSALSSKINEETLYSIFSDGGLLKKGAWFLNLSNKIKEKVINICIEAFRFSIKITVEAFALEGGLPSWKMKELLSEIEEIKEKWFIGNRNSEELFKAIEKNQESLMCLDYENSKKEVILLRAMKNLINGQVVLNILF